MLHLLGEAVVRRHFGAEERESLRIRRVEGLKAGKTSAPQSLLPSYGRALLFAGHPYGRPVGGSEQSLAQIPRAELSAYYAAQAGADRATLVIGGDFDPARISKEGTAVFGAWPRAASMLAPLPGPARVHGRRVLLVDAPGSAQTYLWLGNVGVPRRYPQRAALNISSTAFGGSFGSMLNQELRVKAGLSYDASASFNRGTVAGEFAISSFTQTENTARALELALATLARLRHDGLDAARIDSARNYLLGQYPLALETATDWAVAFAELDLYGLPESYIGQFGTELTRVDTGAIRAVIDEAYPAAEDLDIVLIGDAARIRDAAAKFGPVTTMPLAAPDFSPAADAR